MKNCIVLVLIMAALALGHQTRTIPATGTLGTLKVTVGHNIEPTYTFNPNSVYILVRYNSQFNYNGTVTGLEGNIFVTMTANSKSQMITMYASDDTDGVYLADYTPTSNATATWRFYVNSTSVGVSFDSTFTCGVGPTNTNTTGEYDCPVDVAGTYFPDQLPSPPTIYALVNSAIALAQNASTIAQQALTLAQANKNTSFELTSSVTMVIFALLAILFFRN